MKTLNKKSLSLIGFGLTFLIFLMPYVLYPLIERSLSEMYEKNFDSIDSSLILRAIKTIIFLYIWTDQFSMIIIRIFILSAFYTFGIYLLEIDGKIKFMNLVLYIFAAELILIIGNYIVAMFNYMQLMYDLGKMKINVSPLDLSFYISGIIANPIISVFFNSLSVFTLIYFYVINRLIHRNVSPTRYQYAALTIIGIMLFILLKIADPVSAFFFDNKQTGAL